MHESADAGNDEVRFASMIDLNYDAIRDLAVDAGTTIAVAALWLLAGFWLSRVAGSWVRGALSRHSLGRNGAVLLSRLVSLVIRIASVLIVLSTFGVSGTGLLAVVSALTVAIGLSLQDVLKNFFAGIYLLLERPFRTGDRILVRDVVGEVQGIDIRTTLIKNVNNELVLVPNATIFTEILRNDTYFGVRRLEFTITSESRSVYDIEQKIHAALEEIDVVKRPIPAPRITASDPTHLTVLTSLLVDNTDEAQNAAAQAVIDALPGDTVEVASA